MLIYWIRRHSSSLCLWLGIVVLTFILIGNTGWSDTIGVVGKGNRAKKLIDIIERSGKVVLKTVDGDIPYPKNWKEQPIVEIQIELFNYPTLIYTADSVRVVIPVKEEREEILNVLVQYSDLVKMPAILYWNSDAIWFNPSFYKDRVDQNKIDHSPFGFSGLSIRGELDRNFFDNIKSQDKTGELTLEFKTAKLILADKPILPIYWGTADMPDEAQMNLIVQDKNGKYWASASLKKNRSGGVVAQIADVGERVNAIYQIDISTDTIYVNPSYLFANTQVELQQKDKSALYQASFQISRAGRLVLDLSKPEFKLNLSSKLISGNINLTDQQQLLEFEISKFNLKEYLEAQGKNKMEEVLLDVSTSPKSPISLLEAGTVLVPGNIINPLISSTLNTFKIVLIFFSLLVAFLIIFWLVKKLRNFFKRSGSNQGELQHAINGWEAEEKSSRVFFLKRVAGIKRKKQQPEERSEIEITAARSTGFMLGAIWIYDLVRDKAKKLEYLAVIPELSLLQDHEFNWEKAIQPISNLFDQVDEQFESLHRERNNLSRELEQTIEEQNKLKIYADVGKRLLPHDWADGPENYRSQIESYISYIEDLKHQATYYIDRVQQLSIIRRQAFAIQETLTLLDVPLFKDFVSKLDYLPPMKDTVENIQSCVEQLCQYLKSDDALQQAIGDEKTNFENTYQAKFREIILKNWESFSTFFILEEYLNHYYAPEHTYDFDPKKAKLLIGILNSVKLLLRQFCELLGILPDEIDLFKTKYNQEKHSRVGIGSLLRRNSKLLEKYFQQQLGNRNNIGTIYEVRFWGYTGNDSKTSEVILFEPSQW